jgi:hypothetical protein
MKGEKLNVTKQISQKAAKEAKTSSSLCDLCVLLFKMVFCSIINSRRRRSERWRQEEWDVALTKGGLYRLSRREAIWKIEGC